MAGYGSASATMNSLLLAPGVTEDDVCLLDARALLLLSISGTESTKSQESVFVQYIKVLCSTDSVKETFGCVCLR